MSKDKIVFDIDLFLKFVDKKKITIEAGHISEWLKCSVRYVQKWAKENDVKYTRNKGIKYYLWNKETLEKFAEWHNERVTRQPKKSYYVPVKKKEKPIVIKPKRTFITIKDIVLENQNNFRCHYSTKITYIQKWCKTNEIPFTHFQGRKYYIIDQKIKKRIVKAFLMS